MLENHGQNPDTYTDYFFTEERTSGFISLIPYQFTFSLPLCQKEKFLHTEGSSALLLQCCSQDGSCDPVLRMNLKAAPEEKDISSKLPVLYQCKQRSH